MGDEEKEVSYFPDLSPYTYWDNRPPRQRPLYPVPLFNVGWLEYGHPFFVGVVREDEVWKLEFLCGHKLVHHTLGWFWCSLCLWGRERPDPGEQIKSGSAEIVLLDMEAGMGFAAPDLVGHYVRAHGYLPPEEFLVALRKQGA